jgi:hypothetical protein
MSGFVARSFLFLGPSAVSFGYLDGTAPIPVTLSVVLPTIMGPLAVASHRTFPTILIAREAKKKKGRS